MRRFSGPVGASFRGLVDRFGARGDAALQDGQGETDGVLALRIEPFGAVHALADVVGDGLVQVLLVRGEFVGDGFGDAFGEQGLALEGQQLFLDHAAHDAAGVGLLGGLSSEPVGVDQGEEELEVVLLS